MATVKDLTTALSIGREEGKKDALVATQSGGNKGEDMTGYGSNWPGTMKDQGFGDEPGTDPAEMIQLELPLDLVNKLKIMAQENPEIAQGIMDGLKISQNNIRGTGKSPLVNDNDYAPGSEKWPKTPGRDWQIADISDSIKRENVGGTLRDLVLPLAIKEYGKTPSGGYKNPGALLSIMKKLG